MRAGRAYSQAWGAMPQRTSCWLWSLLQSRLQQERIHWLPTTRISIATNFANVQRRPQQLMKSFWIESWGLISSSSSYPHFFANTPRQRRGEEADGQLTFFLLLCYCMFSSSWASHFPVLLDSGGIMILVCLFLVLFYRGDDCWLCQRQQCWRLQCILGMVTDVWSCLFWNEEHWQARENWKVGLQRKLKLCSILHRRHDISNKLAPSTIQYTCASGITQLIIRSRKVPSLLHPKLICLDENPEFEKMEGKSVCCQ